MTGLPRVVIIMGVCGAGKSAVGAAVADRLQRPFIDADDLHPVTNKVKMAEGRPLDDSDRMPWLDTVARAAAAGKAVVACSALRRRYRQRLETGISDLFFVELDVSRAELERRLRQRSHDFMPTSLLDSQLATLEILEPDERGVRVPADRSFDEVVAGVLNQLEGTSQAVGGCHR